MQSKVNGNLKIQGYMILILHKNKNAVQEYHYAIGYGVNSFWHTELELEAETQPTDDAITPFQATHMEWENIFQLADKGEYWLDPGVYLAYEAPLINKQVGQFEGKILLEKDFQKVSNILILVLIRKLAEGADPHTDAGISWSTKYRLSQYFEPGFEYWNDFSAIDSPVGLRSAKPSGGPVFYGRLLTGILNMISVIYSGFPMQPPEEN